MIYCYHCKELSHTKYNCPLLQGKQQQLAKEQSDSRSCVSEEQIKEQLYQIFQQFQTSSFHLLLWPLWLEEVILLHFLLYLYYRFRSFSSHDWEQKYCVLSWLYVFFSFCYISWWFYFFYSRHRTCYCYIILVSLAYVIYIPNFPFNLLTVSKIIRALNCSVKLYFTFWEFQKLGTKMIGNRHEKDRLYYLNLV